MRGPVRSAPYLPVVNATALCISLGRRDEALSLELRGDDGHFTLTLDAGGELAVELSGQRRCIGHRPPGSGTLVACPNQRTGTSSNQCPDCFAASMMLPCLRCEGDRCQNPKRRVACVQPDNHAVYLAAFAPGVYKVGVARWERRRERLVEQGARAAVIVGRDDGQQARRVEAQIKRLVDDEGNQLIPDKRTFHEKLTLLTVAGDRPQLEDELRRVWPLIRPRLRGRFLDEIETVDLPEAPLLDCPPRVVSAHADLRVRGVIEAVCGQTLLIDSDSGERVALDAGGLVGYALRPLAADEVGVGQLVLAV